MNNDVAEFLIENIDDSNFHVCGNNWTHLNQLLDCPGDVYGDLRSWIVAAAAMIELPGFELPETGDSYVALEALIYSSVPPELLGVTDAVWQSLEYLPEGCVVGRLRELADEQSGSSINTGDPQTALRLVSDHQMTLVQ